MVDNSGEQVEGLPNEKRLQGLGTKAAPPRFSARSKRDDLHSLLTNPYKSTARTVKTIHVESFAAFAAEVSAKSHQHGLAWRGQANSKWPLSTSAFRAEIERLTGYAKVLHSACASMLPTIIATHVKNRECAISRELQKAVGADPHLQLLFGPLLTSRIIHRDQDEYAELLAVGQHYELQTSLLDVTNSPYIALYFAAEQALKERKTWREKGKMAVWQIPAYHWAAFSEGDKMVLERRYQAYKNSSEPLREVKETEAAKDTDIRIRSFHPRIFRNKRLIAQNGSFVYVCPNLPLDLLIPSLVDRDGRKIDKDFIRYTLPAKLALECLVHLAQMNIRKSVLFPDLVGSMIDLNIAANHYDYDGLTSGSFHERGSMYYPNGTRKRGFSY